jgi:hypothetical protein
LIKIRIEQKRGGKRGTEEKIWAEGERKNRKMRKGEERGEEGVEEERGGRGRVGGEG